MKTIILILICLFARESLISQPFLKEHVQLDAGRISAWFQNFGVFDQDTSILSMPGLRWPKDSIRTAVYSTGFTIAAKVNDSIRMASGFYSGEYRPGYCVSGQFFTDTNFRFYKVTRGDSYTSNPDWINWGQMVPYGAPYVDVDNNGMYNYLIDTPGVKDAAQTIFICLTDADPAFHQSQTFGGGTLPLGAEVHLTGWVYDNTDALKNIQFLEWEVVNNSLSDWNGFYVSVICDSDLGDGNDDYIGCDSIRNLGICYNADNFDGSVGFPQPQYYGENPPAFGIMFLTLGDQGKKMTSFVEQIKASSGSGAPCERGTQSPFAAYSFMRGLKNDETPHVVPLISPPQITKYLYSGDPETNSGWNYPTGKVFNCNGELTGQLVPGSPSDKRFIISNGWDDLNILPGQKRRIFAAQLITRGINNLNAVTALKQLADTAIRKSAEISVTVTPVSNEVAATFMLHQNYPNPFNPVTKIKFDIPSNVKSRTSDVKLIIYDALGKEVATLVNEKLGAGSYQIEFNGINCSSGIYFYKLVAGYVSEVKRMILIK